MNDFQKFLQDLSSIYWWISVFIVGVIVSIAGDVFYKLLDKTSTKSLASLRMVSQQRKKKILEQENALVNELRENNIYFIWFQTRTTNQYILGFSLFISSLLLILMALFLSSFFSSPVSRVFRIGFAFIALISILVSMSMVFYGRDSERIIWKVLDKKAE